MKVYKMKNQLNEYINKGWKCILLRPNDKRPLWSNWQNDYIATVDDIEKRTSQYSDFNIGVVTGKVSNLFVLDIDCKNDVNGYGELEKHCKEHGHLFSYKVKTPSGGEHIYFQYPDGFEISNKVGFIQGCDIRGDNGYVVAPPSKTGSGEYSIVDPLHPQPAPDWLLAFVLGEEDDMNNASPFHLPETISEGARDITLFKFACSLNAKSISDKEIGERLHQVNSEIVDPPMSFKEIEKIINSALKYPKGQKFYDFTDLGNSERFNDQWHEELLYCSDQKRWYIWSNTHWRPDKEKRILEYAKDTVLNMVKEADEIDIKSFKSWARASQSASRIQNILKLSESALSITSDQFNKEKMQFNVKNGTLDLDSLSLLPHDRTQLHSVCAPVVYKEDADCPKFKKCLDEIFEGRTEVVDYFKRILGYCLTGDTQEQCIFFFYGDGKNGKSTILNVITAMFGEYHKRANSDTFLTSSSKSIRSDVARLRGSRLVTGSEVGEGHYLDEPLIKDLTGGETVTARMLYQNEIEFVPEFKVITAVNALPQVRGMDKGIWRRLKILSFDYTVPDGEEDPDLFKKLKCEMSGILNFALEGLKQWKEQRLNEPDCLTALQENYRIEMDDVQRFIDANCTIGNGHEAGATELYQVYKSWAYENDLNVLTQSMFGKRLSRKGFPKSRRQYQGTKSYVYDNIRLDKGVF